MKSRIGPDGFHLFDRRSGLNILIDEVHSPQKMWSSAPRQVSMALTNLCDLQCPYCYAPKHRAMLDPETIGLWLEELDQNGCLGVGFGGGEPTLHPQFAEICRQAAQETDLAVTFTTHGQRLLPSLLEELAGNIHFIRISMDGVGYTYESFRGRSFSALIERLHEARQISPIGINVVINDQTVSELDALAEIAHKIDASELLLLPQQATSVVRSAGESVRAELENWVHQYQGQVRLSVSEAGAAGLPVCDPLEKETGLRAYSHIDASGVMKGSSYEANGISIGADGVIAAVNRLKASKGSEI